MEIMESLLIIAASVILAILAGLIISSYFIFIFSMTRRKPSKKKSSGMIKYEEYLKPHLEYLKSLDSELLEITSFDGLKLRGILYTSGVSRNTVICIHGYKSNSMFDFPPFVKFYIENNMNVLLVDDRSHGKSEGKYIGFGWLDRLDCKKWCELITEKIKDGNIVLHGISMGGATVMMASGEDLPSNVVGIIEDCGYSNAVEEVAHVLKSNMHLPAYLYLPFLKMWCRILIKYNFNDNNSVKQIMKSKVPFLFIHGGNDDFVPTKMVYPVYEACPNEKFLYIFDNCSHAESYLLCKEEYQKAVVDFLGLVLK